MKIENFAAADQDCRAVLAVDTSHSKCRYRLALALLLQQRPLEAKGFIDLVMADLVARDTKILSEKDIQAVQRDQASAQTLQDDIIRAISETRGLYNLKELAKESKSGAGISRKHMNYESPDIRLQDIPNKGRGFIAVKAIPAAHLVAVSKAFALTPTTIDGMTLTTEFPAKTNNVTTGAQLLPLVIRELTLHPEIGQELYSLAAGKSYTEPVKEEDFDRVDLKRLSGIIYNNRFSAFTDVLRMYISAPVSTNSIAAGKSPDSDNVGLWIKPSFFNHSCLPNCGYSILGDFMFIVTNRAVAEGDELTIPYCDVLKSFQDRQKIFGGWNESEGFTCLCSRCEFNRKYSYVSAAENNVRSAYERGVELCSQGIDMGRVADHTMPPERRKALLSLCWRNNHLKDRWRSVNYMR